MFNGWKNEDIFHFSLLDPEEEELENGLEEDERYESWVEQEAELQLIEGEKI